ncbi:MAG: DUF4115 domain-containing protein, partial [Pseudomonadota bacterium]
VAPPGAEAAEDPAQTADSGFEAPRDERLDRLYRPQALDVPVLTARDAPISTLDPSEVGTFRPELPSADTAPSNFASDTAPANFSSNNALASVTAEEPGVETPVVSPQVLSDQPQGVRMVAVRPAWVRVRAADGTVLFEGIMNAGDTWDVPVTEEPSELRVGESGSIYFALNGQHYGPAGPSGQVTSGLALDAQTLAAALQVADLNQDEDLMRYVAELQGVAETPEAPIED